MVDGEPIGGIHGQQRAGLQPPAVAVADVMAELPCATRILTPVAGVVAEAERETGTAAARGLNQREPEVQIIDQQVVAGLDALAE